MDERRENITTFTWLPWQYSGNVEKVTLLVKEYIVNYYIFVYIFVKSLVDDLSTWLGS